MVIFYPIVLKLLKQNIRVQSRQYANQYTRTLNMPAMKLPMYVKKGQRPQHDRLIREV